MEALAQDPRSMARRPMFSRGTGTADMMAAEAMKRASVNFILGMVRSVKDFF